MQTTNQHGQPVLLALSGGVDSAVAALLLKKAGYTVRGAVICFSPAHQGAVLSAQRAADELGIQLDVLHCEEDFKQQVILPFCEAYVSGRTPSPCPWCNPLVKFAALACRADELGIRQIASGHYAQICYKGADYFIATASSAARDQSYMLYRLPQSLLARLLLPLGPLDKAAIRGLALEHGLTSADAPDSQEICFIPDGDYPTYIQSLGYADKPGRFIGPSGEDLGPHLGVSHYTIGQRRGLGISGGSPLYVGGIRPDGGVQLVGNDALLSAEITLGDFITPNGQPLLTDTEYQVKIRSAAKPVPCRLQYSPAGEPVVRFATPQRAPAPGQHAVLYQEGLVVGGGVIRSTVRATSSNEHA